MELELTHNGYDVPRAGDGAAALEICRARATPDLFVLDLMLPGRRGARGGAPTCASTGSTKPILMLTARADTRDVVTGFDAGADDYLRKPFEMPELLSRVRALLKRADARARSADVRGVGGRGRHLERRRATVDGEPSS